MLSRRKTFRLLGCTACLFGVLSGGCESDLEQAMATPREDTPDANVPGESPEYWSLRRLTRDELTGTYGALVGMAPESLKYLTASAADGAPPPAPSSFEVDVYRQIATEAATAGADVLLGQWGCDRDAVCLAEAASSWLERAYRGPLTDEEREWHLTLLANSADPRPALVHLLELVFQSPRYLYVLEQGLTPEGHNTARELTSWELAARLSYFLWSEPPDGALREDAAADRLSDPWVLETHARRLLADPRAARTLGIGLQRWAAPDLGIVAKADSVYPEFDPELRASMLEQFIRFASMAVEQQLSFAGILSTSRTPLDGRLRSLLGVVDGDTTPPVDPKLWTTLDLREPRFGLLTLPGVLTSNARADDSSPIARGLFVREKLLCQPISPPPPGVAVLPANDGSGASFRERIEQHTDNPVCAGCHELMDPLGVPFEVYDGLGRLRGDFDAISTSGKLDGVATPVHFSDLHGLVSALLGAPEASRCWARHWMEGALGPAAAADEALLAELATHVGDNASLTDLIVELVTAPAFRRMQGG